MKTPAFLRGVFCLKSLVEGLKSGKGFGTVYAGTVPAIVFYWTNTKFFTLRKTESGSLSLQITVSNSEMSHKLW